MQPHHEIGWEQNKNINDLNAMKAAKVISQQELNHQMHQCSELATPILIDYELWNHNLIMINIKSTTT